MEALSYFIRLPQINFALRIRTCLHFLEHLILPKKFQQICCSWWVVYCVFLPSDPHKETCWIVVWRLFLLPWGPCRDFNTVTSLKRMDATNQSVTLRIADLLIPLYFSIHIFPGFLFFFRHSFYFRLFLLFLMDFFFPRQFLHVFCWSMWILLYKRHIFLKESNQTLKFERWGIALSAMSNKMVDVCKVISWCWREGDSSYWIRSTDCSWTLHSICYILFYFHFFNVGVYFTKLSGKKNYIFCFKKKKKKFLTSWV